MLRGAGVREGRELAPEDRLLLLLTSDSSEGDGTLPKVSLEEIPTSIDDVSRSEAGLALAPRSSLQAGRGEATRGESTRSVLPAREVGKDVRKTSSATVRDRDDDEGAQESREEPVRAGPGEFRESLYTDNIAGDPEALNDIYGPDLL